MATRFEQIESAIMAQEENGFKMADAALTMDDRFEISYASPGAGNLFNVSPVDLLDQSIYNIYPKSDRFTFEQHQENMQGKINGWVDDIARGRIPTGQPMSGRNNIPFVSKNGGYEPFKAKLGFYPVFVGYTCRQVMAEVGKMLEIEKKNNPAMKFSDEIIFYKDFLRKHDILQVLALFYRVDVRSDEEAAQALKEEKKKLVQMPARSKSNRTDMISIGKGAAVDVISTGGQSWKHVTVSVAIVIALATVGYFYFTGGKEPLPDVPAKSEPSGRENPLSSCKTNKETGEWECSIN